MDGPVSDTSFSWSQPEEDTSTGGVGRRWQGYPSCSSSFSWVKRCINLHQIYCVMLVICTSGCGGTLELTARKDVTKMDEFSSPESGLQENYNQFFFWCEGNFKIQKGSSTLITTLTNNCMKMKKIN